MLSAAMEEVEYGVAGVKGADGAWEAPGLSGHRPAPPTRPRWLVKTESTVDAVEAEVREASENVGDVAP